MHCDNPCCGRAVPTAGRHKNPRASDSRACSSIFHPIRADEGTRSLRHAAKWEIEIRGRTTHFTLYNPIPRYAPFMARLARIVVPGFPHHVTQSVPVLGIQAIRTVKTASVGVNRFEHLE
jgi:hypothetical protein